MIAGEMVGGADPRREGKAIGEPQLLPGIRQSFELAVPGYEAPAAE